MDRINANSRLLQLDLHNKPIEFDIFINNKLQMGLREVIQFH